MWEKEKLRPEVSKRKIKTRRERRKFLMIEQQIKQGSKTV
jgi:hypothetical protein